MSINNKSNDNFTVDFFAARMALSFNSSATIKMLEDELEELQKRGCDVSAVLEIVNALEACFIEAEEHLKDIRGLVREHRRESKDS